MDLEQLKKRLYKKEDGIEDRPKAPDTFEPGRQALPVEKETPQWASSDSSKFHWFNRIRKILWFVGGAAVLVALGLIIWFFIGRGSFDSTKVSLSIYGQDRLVSGEETNYVVSFKNSTSASLKNATLEFFYSDASLPLDQSAQKQNGLSVSTKNLGDIAAGQAGQAEFNARVMGEKDSQQKFSAKLTYQLGSTSTSYNNSADFTSVVISVPLVLNFDLPDKLVSGQTLNFTLKYLNTSDTSFNDSQIQVNYPDGFVFDSAYPTPSSGDNVWSLPEIGSQEEGSIIIKGTLNGNEGESKVFNAKIGVQQGDTFLAYASTLASPMISVSPLTIQQALIGLDKLVADLGQTLRYQVNYSNTTNVTISPVVISVKIDSQAVDLSSVSSLSGFFDSSSGTLIWNASTLPALNSLAAGQTGEVEYTLRLKDKLPVNSFADKNFTILNTAQIDSPNVPISLVGTQLKGTNQLAVKVNSRLVLNVNGYYYDNLIANFGPLPPRVGQTTTYTIYLRLLNISNDLSDVSVEATLPPYVQWVGRTYPTSGEDIKYDSATGKLVWHLDSLSAATGVLLPVKQIAFQVALVPSVSQVGNVVDVIKDAAVSGTDTFTGAQVASSPQTLKSDMPDDQTMGWGKGNVTQ